MGLSHATYLSSTLFVTCVFHLGGGWAMNLVWQSGKSMWIVSGFCTWTSNLGLNASSSYLNSHCTSVSWDGKFGIPKWDPETPGGPGILLTIVNVSVQGLEDASLTLHAGTSTLSWWLWGGGSLGLRYWDKERKPGAKFHVLVWLNSSVSRFGEPLFYICPDGFCLLFFFFLIFST